MSQRRSKPDTRPANRWNSITVDYLPVETDGAARAAARIAELI